MRRMTVALFAALLFTACGEADPTSRTANAGDPSVAPATPDVPAVLATVDGDEIRVADLPSDALAQLNQMDQAYRQQRHDLLSDAVDAAVAERLLEAEAAERGGTVAELLAAEVGQIAAPSDVEVEAWYAENRARLQGQSLEQLREQIREFLRSQRSEGAAKELDARLREKYGVTVALDPFRVDLDNAGSPALGPSGAAVTLVEFSDFECPFCGRFFPTIKPSALASQRTMEMPTQRGHSAACWTPTQTWKRWLQRPIGLG